MRAHEFINELTFHGSPCTKDCSGHKAGYEWAKRKGVATPPSGTHPSFARGAALQIQHRNQGLNPISGGIKGQGGKFQKFQPQK